MADSNKNNNVPNNWEDAAGNQPPKKERKPLKLNSAAKTFNPGQAGGGFVPPEQQYSQPGYQQGGYQQGGYQQGGYQQGGFQQGGYQQAPYQQGGFQQGGFQQGGAPFQQLAQQGFQPGVQPGFQQPSPKGSQQIDNAPKGNQGQPQPTTSTTQAKPTTPVTNQQQTQSTSTTAPKKDTKPAEQPKKEAPKEPVKKAPEPKVEPKKESKKAGKKGEEKKTDKKASDKIEVVAERGYLKLQNLMANLKNAKPEKIDIEASIKDKTKFDDLVDETRQPFSIVFIGHVDAGKSTTCGNILLLTGQVDQNDVRKLKQEAKEKNRESWWIAYLMDIGEEEKTKGKTVEVGKARFNTESKRFTILDAPGHKNYVPNMIAGASQADVAALVISAKTGEFESGFEKGGQTTEHAMLAKSLGVRDLIVLINKMDENTINWSQTRYENIKKQLTPFLRDSCGYDIEKNVFFLPMSALNGDNIMSPIESKEASWYKGPTFFELLDKLPLPPRDPEGPIRIPVLDKFKDGNNLFVFGKLESGTITHGLKLTIVPSGETLTINAIYNDDDKRIPYAKPGEGIKLLVKGIEDDYINRGDMICSNHNFSHVTNEFECELKITELPEHKAIMSSGYTCIIHIHSAQEEIYIKEIKSEYNKAEDTMKPAKYLKAGSTGIVRIATKDVHPLCVEKFDFMPHLGRFTLRDEGKTIASGKVLRIKPLYKE